MQNYLDWGFFFPQELKCSRQSESTLQQILEELRHFGTFFKCF